jgi:hypothetical protein
MYLRVEPKKLHLGNSRVIPYEVNLANPSEHLQRYEKAPIIIGEDPALTRINRRLGSGAIEKIWLLSCVDAQPFPDEPNCVQTLRTKFFAGKDLNKLEQIAEGPEWMKDIRISPVIGSETGIHIYGRPQPMEFSGNITHTTISGIEKLNEKVISGAPFIDERLFPVGSGEWGGANDIMAINAFTNIILAHRAERTGEDLSGRHYEVVLLGHNLIEKSIVNLGVLATADFFGENWTTKADNVRDVAFPGGFRNGKPGYVTVGVGDGSFGLADLQKSA